MMLSEAIYLSAYLMISDGFINDLEWKALKSHIFSNDSLQQPIYEEVLKIIQDDDNKPQFEDIVAKVSEMSFEEKKDVLMMCMTIAQIDNGISKDAAYELAYKTGVIQ